jgi:hypothetical protein
MVPGIREYDPLSEDRRSWRGPREFHDLAPNMCGMLIEQCRRGVAKEKFGYNE